MSSTSAADKTPVQKANSARQNFSPQCEQLLHKQITMELVAAYIYQSMSAYFAQDCVALRGISKFFRDSYKEEHEHAQQLIDYVMKRGGKMVFYDIAAPLNEWVSAKLALEQALKLEKEVNTSLLSIGAVAEAEGDQHLADYLQSNYLPEQVESIKKIAGMLTNLERVGNEGLGLFLFDQELLRDDKAFE